MIFEIRYDNLNIKQEFEGTKCIFGRSRKADIQIEKEALSRNHFEIEYDGQHFYLTDLNSTNGVYVNSERIPPSQKVLYQNFFPIEIGGEISIYVQPSEQGKVVKEAGPKMFASSDAEEPEELTRVANLHEFQSSMAKSLGNPAESTPTPPRRKNIIQKNKISKKTPIVVLFVCLGAGYFFYELGRENPDQVTSGPLAQTSLKQNLNFKIQNLDFKSYMTKNDCSELGDLCLSLGLNRPQELISLQDDKFIVYINFNEYLKQLNSIQIFKQLPEDQAEFAMAFFATQPAVLAEFRKRKMAYLIVVGVDAIDDLTRMKYAMLVDIAKIPAFTPESHAAYFSNIFHGEIYRPFRISLRPHLNFTTL
jgi:hypothetical protein